MTTLDCEAIRQKDKKDECYVLKDRKEAQMDAE